MNVSDIGILLVDCQSGNPDRQIAAMLELEKLQAFSAAMIIANLLSSFNKVVRSTAAEVLGHLGKADIETVGPALMNALDDQEKIVRSDAIESLGELGYEPAIENILSVLRNDVDWLVRASAAEALGNFAGEAIVAGLEHALQDPEKSVRSYAAVSLGLIAPPTFLPTLQKYTDSEMDPSPKLELLAAGYRLGSNSNMQQILDMLDGTYEYFASSILNSLHDLTSWEVHGILRADADRIQQALLKVEQRFPLLYGQAEEIKKNLTALE
jgi:HEAT repeat protein